MKFRNEQDLIEDMERNEGSTRVKDPGSAQELSANLWNFLKAPSKKEKQVNWKILMETATKYGVENTIRKLFESYQ